MGEQTTLPLLTASRLRDARACQRKHRYRYIDRYAPVEDASPLRFGTMFHHALAAWWSGEGDSRLHDAICTIPTIADPFEAAMVRALMMGYDARWGAQELNVLTVEQEFRVHLVNPETGAASRSWDLGGKFDAIAQEPTGRTILVEHKTTSQDIAQGGDYWKRLRLDGQVSIYFQGARAAGYEIEECLYDVIRKPSIRPLKATPDEARKYTKSGDLYANQREHDETAEEYFARLCESIIADPDKHYGRGTIVRLEAEMEEAMFDTWVIGQQLRSAMTADRFPRNVDACVSFGSTCAFFPVCSGEASLDDARLYRKLETSHPELEKVSS